MLQAQAVVHFIVIHLDVYCVPGETPAAMMLVFLLERALNWTDLAVSLF